MDLYDTKSRVAEAFVESIFRRARYHIQPFRTTHSTLRIGREDFSPNFAVDNGGGESKFHVEVKYRPSIHQFIALENQRKDSSIFTLARRLWPALYFVLVTDHPDPGRSCFQAIAFVGGGPGSFTAVDLVDLRELKIFPQNIEEHERLLLRVFDQLTHV